MKIEIVKWLLGKKIVDKIVYDERKRILKHAKAASMIHQYFSPRTPFILLSGLRCVMENKNQLYDGKKRQLLIEENQNV